MSDQPRCHYCGRFFGANDEIESKLVWEGGAVPEPSHEVYWHKQDCTTAAKPNEVQS